MGLFVTKSGETDLFKEAYLVAAVNKGDLKSYMLVSKATVALFGGSSTWDILVKLLSRVAPLITAPRKVKAAFALQYQIRLRKRRSRRLGKWRNIQSAIALRGLMKKGGVKDQGSSSIGSSTGEVSSSIQPSRIADIRSQEHDHVKSESGIVGCISRALSSRDSEDREKYYLSIPRALFSPIFVLSTAMCLFIIFRLVGWGTCNGEATPSTCIVRSFPVFAPFSSDGECACDVISYFETSRAAMNVSHTHCNSKAVVKKRDTFKKMTSQGHLASTVLLFIGCTESIEVTNTLFSNMDRATVLVVRLVRRSPIQLVPSPTTTSPGGRVLEPNRLSNKTLFTVHLHVFDGERTAPDLSWLGTLPQLRELKSFSDMNDPFYDQRVRNNWGIRRRIANSVTLPPSIGQATNLLTFDWRAPHSAIPSEFGLLSNLHLFRSYYGGYTKLPSEMGRLVFLTEFRLTHNPFLVEIPTNLFRVRLL